MAVVVGIVVVAVVIVDADITAAAAAIWTVRTKTILHNISASRIAHTTRYHQWLNLWPALSAYTNIWCICH